jgi:hypothetical protein
MKCPVILVFLVFLVVMTACTPNPIIPQDGNSDDSNLDSISPAKEGVQNQDEPAKTNKPIESSSSLSIPNQKILRDVVYIPKASFERSGFIAIFARQGELSEELLGVSDIYIAGDYSDIGVKIENYQAGMQLIAYIYEDNANNLFEKGIDSRIDTSKMTFLIQ